MATSSSYRINNLHHIRSVMSQYYQAAVTHARAMKEKTGIDMPIQFNLEKAMKAVANHYKRRYGSSKYTPRQGAQECARRRRQIAKGMICN